MAHKVEACDPQGAQLYSRTPEYCGEEKGYYSINGNFDKSDIERIQRIEGLKEKGLLVAIIAVLPLIAGIAVVASMTDSGRNILFTCIGSGLFLTASGTAITGGFMMLPSTRVGNPKLWEAERELREMEEEQQKAQQVKP